MVHGSLMLIKDDLSVLVGDEIFVVSNKAMKSQKGTFFESGILDKIDDKNFYVNDRQLGLNEVSLVEGSFVCYEGGLD